MADAEPAAPPAELAAEAAAPPIEAAPAPTPAPPTSKPATSPSKASSRTASRAALSKSSSSRAASKASLKSTTSIAKLSGSAKAKSRGSVKGSTTIAPPATETPTPAAPGQQDELHATVEETAEGEMPAGIMPLFLTGNTQDLFKVKPGEDVTPARPFKLVPKADIMSDLQARAAISDFFPAKQAILDFPGEAILVHHDANFKWGQNYYICITPAAMDLIINPPVVESAAAVEVVSNAPTVKKVVSKKWESYGSEKEIDAERVVNNRDLLQIKVSRRRRLFGAPCKFRDRDAQDGFSECKPFKDPTYDISRMELSTAVQAVPQLIENAVQTPWSRPQNFAVQYQPAVMSREQQEQLMSSTDVEEFLNHVTLRFEKALQQNSTLDIFEDDYQNLGEADVALEQGAHSSLQEYQSFTDLQHSKDKCISGVDWHPHIKGVVAVSCAERLAFAERVERGLFQRSRKALILVWSFNDPIHPQLILEAPDDIQCFQFNPHDSNLIVGGCINGQVILWDITEYQDKLKNTRKSSREDVAQGQTSTSGTDPLFDGVGGEDKDKATGPPVVQCVAVSSIEFSHRGIVTDIQWLPKNVELGHTGEMVEKGENGHRELVTSSTDGQVAFWDTRFKKDLKSLDLVWRPFLRVPLSAMDNTFDYSLTKISIKKPPTDKMSSNTDTAKPDDGSNKENKDGKDAKDAKETLFSSKFFSATEEGDLIYADWNAEKSTEDKASRVEHAANYHFAAVTDLHRSPFFPDILLSVGGWSFHIWKEGVTTGPLLSSAPSLSYLVGGRWSPTRPGVFYISKTDGSVEVWDLLDRSHSPSFVQNVTGSAISYMSIRQYPSKSLTSNQFVAAGDDEGTLHILEVPRNLIKPTKNETTFVRSFLDREVRRLGYIRGRKEFRARERAAYEQSALEAPGQKGTKTDGDVPSSAPAPSSTAPAPPASAGRPASGASRALTAASGGEENDEKREQEYLKMERAFLELEGLLPPAEDV
ncbi:WD40-repeat-containing domain protein [Fimicolochytrium jonesii]|uniref:WD40-repeat-containing domain protein n=1 Tax=Fimicolochytrium jonesii TaxID=1396493 RepID=UPI0022FF202F|nr:WD40-repeat-containing domain protein [Fimicolochytrium jonesii]KAI8817694.1 WD40-repeat-containing domain protein [Fimicolochytrium jonesii]